MGFEEEDTISMFKILVAIVLIGDVTFKEGENDTAELTSDPSVMSEAAKLLGVDQQQLTDSITTNTSDVAGEKIMKRLNLNAAADNRDAIAKAFYARLFGWVVTCCNSLLIDADTATADSVSVGILDIFGFECFTVNSLEQLCINITNEQLQSFFNEYIFAAEMAEYAKEGLEGLDIVFVDNQTTLDLLLKKPTGILPQLDEASRMPKATDETFTQSLADLKDHESQAFVPAKGSSDLSFTINHYAGPVKYDTVKFLEKNRDSLSKDVTATLRFAENSLVALLWAGKKNETGTFRGFKGDKRTAKKTTSQTVSGAFTNSLADLLKKIGASKPHFVRCLKPNTEKTPKSWKDEVCFLCFFFRERGGAFLCTLIAAFVFTLPSWLHAPFV